MKIFISLIQMRDSGGITPSTLNLLNEISNQHEISLCVLTYKSLNKNIPDNIKLKKGSLWLREGLAPRSVLKYRCLFDRMRCSYIRIMKRLFGVQYIVDKAVKELKFTEEYDIAIAYANNIYKNGKLVQGGDYDVILKCVHAKRKIAWVHNDPYKCGFTYKICKSIFKDFDATVCVSKDNKRLLDELYPEGEGKSYTVYNMYNIDSIKELAEAEPNPYVDDKHIHLVTVARIDNEQKRVDRIVETCRRLKEDGRGNFDWTIVGDGADREKMQNLTREYGITNLYFVGLKTNPYPYMLHASASVLTSDYEGYGMTVKEAQILGTPTIITNYDAAIETMSNGCEGIICDKSTDGVYLAIKYILDNPHKLDQYREYLKNNPVTNEIASQQFEKLINL